MKRAACWLALAACGGAATAFERAFDAPAFVVRVPGLPDTASVTLAVQASAAAAAGGTRACAGNFLRDLVRQPGMPDRDSIYRAPLDAGTFLVLYILGAPGAQVLHAHLLAAAAGTHCVDAHFSRPMKPGEDEDRWRTSFIGARISPAR